MRAVATTALAGLELRNRGKVRDVYVVDDHHLLLVATDRISAFDVVLPDPIPGKGIILTQLSLFWFDLLRGTTANHLVEADVDRMPATVRAHRDVLRGRAILVRRAKVFPAECIARGYLLGSGWKDYQRSGKVCGIDLPPGLQKNHRFEPPLFTPSTKAEQGHDENISFATLQEIVGPEAATTLRDKTLAVFARAGDHARSRGIVICDTKFEWGQVDDGRVILVDEVLTPDSSRFWVLDSYEAAREAGQEPESFDKEFLRLWYVAQGYRGDGQPPAMPPDFIAQVAQRYIAAYERLTGLAFAPGSQPAVERIRQALAG